MLVRFDDISINCLQDDVNNITNYLIDNNHKVMWAISPLVNDTKNERVFPNIFKAYSDHRVFFNIDKIGLPQLRDDVVVVSHGLIHIDHRLLTKEQQEMSILISSSIIKSKIFVPPFNKWNKDTESICKEFDIELIKFEDGWLSIEHNDFDVNHEKYYFHHRDFGLEKIKNWIK